MLRYINDSSRKLYAFEMDHSCVDFGSEASSSTNQIEATPANSKDSVTAQADIFSNMETFTSSSTLRSDAEASVSDSNSYYGQRDQFDCISTSNDLDVIGTGMWEWGQGVSEKRCGSFETEPEENWLPADSTTPDVSGFNIAESIAKVIDQTIEVKVNRGDKATVSSSDTVEVGSGWKSCAICLEELPETELMVHTICGGTFCSTCLEVSSCLVCYYWLFIAVPFLSL